MVDKNSIFGGMITTLGAAKKTNCDALGIPWEPRYMLIGDANGTDPVPSPSQTKLINQVHRAQINQLRVSPTDANVLIAEVVLPPDVGGWWVRELALEDKDGVFSAVANSPPSYKPVLAQGSGRNQVVRMHIITSGTSNIQLKIDPSVVLATRQYVDEAVNGLLPKNKPAGTYTKVTVNDRGVFVSGSNPTTLAGYGITDTYTKDQIAAMIAQASALPVGSMVSFPVDKVPPGFLEMDGSVKSSATYPDMAAYLGGAFNRGDEGAGNFRMPESRGEGLRGWDHGRGIDIGRAIGSYQLDAIQNIVGAFSAKAVGNGESQKPTGPFAQRDGWGISGGSVDSAAPGVEQFKFDASLAVRTSTETRVRNLAVIFCMKAWNAPINQGNIDVAALEAEIQALRKLPLSGYKGLVVSATGTSALVAIKARSLIVGSGLRARALELLDLSINLATVGLGGLDAGALAPLSWYSAWVATNGDARSGIAALMPIVTGNTTAGSAVVPGIASTALMRPGMQFNGANFPPGAFIKSVDSPTQITASVPATITGVAAPLRFVYEPVLPAGYWAVRVGAFPTDATANKYPLSYQQFGRHARYKVVPGSNVASLPLMVSGAQGSANALVAISVLQFVPPTAVGIALQLIGETNSNSCAAPSGSYTGGLGGPNSPPLNSVGSTSTNRNTQGYFLLEEPRVYYFGQGTAGLMCYGWKDDL